MAWIVIYNYVKFHANPANSFLSRGLLRKKELSINTISPNEETSLNVVMTLTVHLLSTMLISMPSLMTITSVFDSV